MRLIRTDGPWTEGRGYRKRTLLEEAELGLGGAFIQEVRFKEGERVPSHYHRRQTEVFIALTDVEFQINGGPVRMRPGDIVVCEPGDVHGNPRIPGPARILVIKKDYAEDDTVWVD